MKTTDWGITALLCASVMEGVVVASTDAKQYVPGVVLFLLPAINAGISVVLNQLRPLGQVPEPKPTGILAG